MDKLWNKWDEIIKIMVALNQMTGESVFLDLMGSQWQVKGDKTPCFNF